MDIKLFSRFLKMDKVKLNDFAVQLGKIQGSVLLVSKSNVFQQTILERVLNLKNDCLVQVCDVASFSKQLAAKYDNIICFDEASLKDVDKRVVDICDLCDFNKDDYLGNIIDCNLYCLFYYVGNEQKFVKILDNIDNLELTYKFESEQNNVVIADNSLTCLFEFLKYNFVEANNFSVTIKSKNDIDNQKALNILDNSNILFITGQNENLDKTVLYALEKSNIKFDIFELPIDDVVLMNFVCVCVFGKKIN